MRHAVLAVEVHDTEALPAQAGVLPAHPHPFAREVQVIEGVLLDSRFRFRGNGQIAKYLGYELLKESLVLLLRLRSTVSHRGRARSPSCCARAVSLSKPCYDQPKSGA